MYRKTPQREVILNYLKNTKSHPTAEMVYEEVRKSLPSISLATVYRNLNMLAEQGQIQKIDTPEARFDGNPEQHYHFVCQNCQRVFDKPDEDICGNLTSEWKNDGFSVEKIEVVGYGLCNKCR